MPEPMTPEQIADARRALDRAYGEVVALSENGGRRWRTSIPARPDRDSDLILSAGLDAGERLAAEVKRLRAELDELAALADAQAVAAREAGEDYQAIRRDLTAAHNTLCEVIPGRPATVTAAAEKAVRVLRELKAERDNARTELAEERARHGELVAEMQRVRRAAEADRATAHGLGRDYRQARATVERVRAWVNGDVVTGRNEFGQGYREAIRDVRDLLDGTESDRD